MPRYRNCEMYGDSQFVRFSAQCLHAGRGGFVKSGQSVQQLHNMVRNTRSALLPKAIILLGTNNLRQKQTSDQIIFELQAFIDHLQSRNVNQIFILTVPPILRYIKADEKIRRLHKETRTAVNQYIKSLTGNIKPIDIDYAMHYSCGGRKRVDENMFEKFIGNSTEQREDNVHWNLAAMIKVKVIIDEALDSA
jgi:lysophospholipase L1-like esterase